MSTRQRSHWGWGFEDALPDTAERTHLGQQLSMLLGRPLPAPGPYPTLVDARLPAPRIPPGLAHHGADRRDRALHTYGRAFPDLYRGFHGDFAPAPDVVAHPRTEADVAATLAWAAAEGVAVVPFGGGTSVVGGVECDGSAHAGVVSLDMRAMDRVLEIDHTSLLARIQAGATGPVLEEQLAAHGLTLRHFPQSFELSTLGGWIATRAGGHFATNYTHIDDLVASVRMLTPSGPWESRRLPGSGAGPSPDRLVLGSEGTLGVITEAWMRVFRRPVHRSKAALWFDDLDAAVAAIREIAQARLFPANCRLLDRTEALINQVAMGVHVLLLGFESADVPQHHLLEQALDMGRRHGGTLPSPAVHTDGGGRDGTSAAAWRGSFLRAPYRQTGLLTMGVLADTFETACTWDAFAALHEDLLATTNEVLARRCGAGVVSCRFTHVYPDGPAPYYTWLCPLPDDALSAWQEVKAAASDALMRHGATITHHHAVGRTHRPWYDQQRPDLFARGLRAVKTALDPEWLLNPGVLVDQDPPVG